MIVLENIDQRLLGMLQVGFPLTQHPYSGLGAKLGIDGDEVIRRIQDLEARGIVRQIGPVLDARRLGFASTLVAMKIPAEKLPEAERIIREHPGVSHGYERNYDFNIWITLSVPAPLNIEAEVEKLASAAGAQAAFTLPALKVFKLRTSFGADEEVPPAQNENGLPQAVELSDMDRLVINGLQQDLPLIAEPFAPLAKSLNMNVSSFLAQCQSLLARGVIRRFGAAVNHRNAGFKANAMACWAVVPEMVEVVGQKLASLREVSHCYERKTNPLWRYNLFAMVHGHTRAECEKVIGGVSRETGLTDSVTLFSTREFKKIRIRYAV